MGRRVPSRARPPAPLAFESGDIPVDGLPKSMRARRMIAGWGSLVARSAIDASGVRGPVREGRQIDAGTTSSAGSRSNATQRATDHYRAWEPGSGSAADSAGVAGAILDLLALPLCFLLVAQLPGFRWRRRARW
jgi:hypothetical protein